MADNLKKATKKSIHESKVQQLDLGTDIGEFIQKEGLSVIEDAVGQFIERVHENINNEKGMVTTGKISDITIKAEDGAVHVMGNKWLIYQDRGVNGSEEKLYDTPHSYSDKMPPVDVFRDWIREKNIQLRDNEKYTGDASPFKEVDEESKIDGAAWAMAKSVYKRGFKSRNVFSKEIPRLVDDLKGSIADFSVQCIIQAIDVKPEAKRIILP